MNLMGLCGTGCFLAVTKTHNTLNHSINVQLWHLGCEAAVLSFIQQTWYQRPVLSTGWIPHDFTPNTFEMSHIVCLNTAFIARGGVGGGRGWVGSGQNTVLFQNKTITVCRKHFDTFDLGTCFQAHAKVEWLIVTKQHPLVTECSWDSYNTVSNDKKRCLKHLNYLTGVCEAFKKISNIFFF